MSAQKVADDMRETAQQEAARLVREAEGRAELLMQKAQARVEDVEREIDGLKLKRREAETNIEAASPRCTTRSTSSASRTSASATTAWCRIARRGDRQAHGIGSVVTGFGPDFGLDRRGGPFGPPQFVRDLRRREPARVHVARCSARTSKTSVTPNGPTPVAGSATPRPLGSSATAFSASDGPEGLPRTEAATRGFRRARARSSAASARTAPRAPAAPSSSSRSAPTPARTRRSPRRRRS